MYVYNYSEGGNFYQNFIFLDPGAGVLVLGRGQIVHIVKVHYFSNGLQNYGI